MKVKVSETEGETLSYLVGRAMGFKPGNLFRPSADWAQGGPIIERERIALDSAAIRNQWMAVIHVPNEEPWEMRGPTPLIAAMRCYVASRLGQEVDVPEGFASN